MIQAVLNRLNVTAALMEERSRVNLTRAMRCKILAHAKELGGSYDILIDSLTRARLVNGEPSLEDIDLARLSQKLSLKLAGNRDTAALTGLHFCN